MRVEELNAKALKRLGEDRYLLAMGVAKRAEELSKGAKPLVKLDPKKFKLVDVALREIAFGLIDVRVE